MLIEILNSDPKAKKCLTALNDMYKSGKFTQTEYKEARKALTLLLASNNDEYLEYLADKFRKEVK